MTTARNRAIDRIRRDRTLAAKTRLLDVPSTWEDELEEETIPDERLERLHVLPSGPRPRGPGRAHAANARRAPNGGDRARFLVPEETMAATRPREAEDQGRRDPVPRPTGPLLPDRLAAVLAVVYLIFNEGYGGRCDLASEAIRLGRALAELMPDEPEVHGLLSLMLINDARRDARFADDTVILLRDQDRSLWNLDRIAEGRAASIALWRSAAATVTCSRPRSRRCTSTSHRTGGSSPRSTASSPA